MLLISGEFIAACAMTNARTSNPALRTRVFTFTFEFISDGLAAIEPERADA